MAPHSSSSGAAVKDVSSLPQTQQHRLDVAVVGAGISGVATAAHLLRRGLNVAVFERSSVVGGVWHFDPRAPIEPPYPNEHPPQANNTTSTSVFSKQQQYSWRTETEEPSGGGGLSSKAQPSFGRASLLHAPPPPCYAGLKNNVPTSMMRTVLLEWPEGTEEIISQSGMVKYIQDLAAQEGVYERILFDTRVVDVWKEEGVGDEEEEDDGEGEEGGRTATSRRRRRWNLRSTTLVAPNADAISTEVATDDEPMYHEEEREWQFDAVVVASGHYHEPNVPAIPGLSEWKARHPTAVTHSKAYRTPDRFRGKTVLIVGGGVSSSDIARELHGVGAKVYVSSRKGPFDVPVPETAVSVGGVAEFIVRPDGSGESESGGTGGGGKMVLLDGRVLDDVDSIVIATGYLTSYPFLRGLQDPLRGPAEAGDKLIVTGEGILTHNLHRDIWYIPDPTLAFVGVPFHVATFSLFDFQAEVVSRVLAGFATLPSEEDMRREYEARKAQCLASAAGGGGGKGGRGGGAGKGQGNHLRAFHSLMGTDIAYMNRILGWVNSDARRLGVEEMAGVDSDWLGRYDSWKEEVAIRRGLVLPALGKVAKGAGIEQQGDQERHTRDTGSVQVASLSNAVAASA